MNRPAGRLDDRFSDPGADPTGWEQTLGVLQHAQLFWITTVRADGRPHVTPLVAVWVNDALHFCTGDGEQKALNLTLNQEVTLMTGCDTWDHGIDVTVEGRAHHVTDDELLLRLADAWAEKWDGRWQFEVDGGSSRTEGAGRPSVYAVAPTKVMAFGKDPFSQTSYRFGDPTD